MIRTTRATSALLLVVSLALLATASAASADITSTTITTPGSPTVLVADAPGKTVTIAGTAQGSSNTVDLRCYAGTGEGAHIADAVFVADDRTFTATVPITAFAARRCLLRAVQQADWGGRPPGTSPEYPGVEIAAGSYGVATYGGAGPNHGVPTSWNWTQAAGTHTVDLYDAGACGVASDQGFGADLATRSSVWGCAGFFNWRDDAPVPTRSELRVDGRDAYLASSWLSPGYAGMFPATDPHAPTLTVTGRTIDPSGLVTVDEEQRPARCAVATFPPVAATCAPAADTGVRLARRTQTLSGGQVVRMVDTWTSTDGQPHTLDLRQAILTTPSTFGFAGEDPAAVVAGQLVTPDPVRPLRMLVRPTAVGDWGAAVLDPPPATVHVTSDASLDARYAVTVPATGSAVLRADWGTATDGPAATALAAASVEAFRPTPPPVQPPAGPPPADPPKTDPPRAMPDTTAPVLRALSLSRRAFAVGGKATAGIAAAKRKNAVTGTTVRWTTSEAAAVSFTIRRKSAGRRKGAACVTPKRAAKRAKRCTLLTTTAVLRPVAATAGRHTLAFTGRVGRKALPAGPYVLEARATDAAGNRSKVRTLTFTVRPTHR